MIGASALGRTPHSPSAGRGRDNEQVTAVPRDAAERSAERVQDAVERLVRSMGEVVRAAAPLEGCAIARSKAASSKSRIVAFRMPRFERVKSTLLATA
jgi:hypothetical protein